MGVWRNGSASDSRSEGWELESLCPHFSHDAHSWVRIGDPMPGSTRAPANRQRAGHWPCPPKSCRLHAHRLHVCISRPPADCCRSAQTQSMHKRASPMFPTGRAPHSHGPRHPRPLRPATIRGRLLQHAKWGCARCCAQATASASACAHARSAADPREARGVQQVRKHV